MANFATPFASTGPRRTPNLDEKANGFPCGGADQLLFNGMFHRIEAELGALISFAGLTASDADLTQVLQAVQALIDGATGGGDPDQFLLINQAVSRLPIFPSVNTGDGRLGVNTPANGIVRIPGGLNFLHRGIKPYTTAQTDFNTVSNRTYHLRWNPTDGFQLKNVGDNAYNPDGLPEANPAFDSKFDDMLVARVITNSTNVPTITNLANLQKLKTTAAKTTFELGPDWASSPGLTFPVAWARTPQFSVQSINVEVTQNFESVTAFFCGGDRYSGYGKAQGYVVDASVPNRYISGYITVEAFA